MIYNAGTISFSGNTVTGSGTSFTAPSSQIRIGQTLLIASNPVQLVQITAINSATSLTVTPAAAPAVSDQRYGIFVTDSLSVDGLAQSISQLIKEYDENIGSWEAFATTNANQSVTVTINGQSIIIPAMGKLLQKGSNGALTVKDGGTGATDAAGARAALDMDNIYLRGDRNLSDVKNKKAGRDNLGVNATPNMWYVWLNPNATSRLAFPSCSSAEEEIRVRISKDGIRVKGILRYPPGTMTNGKTILTCQPIDIDGNTRTGLNSTFATGYVQYSNGTMGTAILQAVDNSGGIPVVIASTDGLNINWIILDLHLAFTSISGA
ncbi:hypothetical protein RN333_15890 [Enterobacter kobei]|uniref:hypothetical protein n=1 Tax=Enterobacter kobei TaxID=208224 RepID=UPI0028CFF3CC|nr:hypothetical protein [Enterobacter kobei]WNP33562.1 hypothetical protein RN333_15890 [Enterobacter kobei]